MDSGRGGQSLSSAMDALKAHQSATVPNPQWAQITWLKTEQQQKGHECGKGRVLGTAGNQDQMGRIRQGVIGMHIRHA